MNAKILSKLTITIFLAIVLLEGTIAAMSPQSLFLGESYAQPYYDGEMYNGYDSYEPPSQYQSYQPDFEPKYSSYDKDNSYNTNANGIINKIKCFNNNINIDGENTGDIKLGNDGQGAATEEGYWSTSSFGSGKTGEGFDKKSLDCVTNNNENIAQDATGQSGQGPQGIQGPTGLTGPTGPIGPQGPAGIVNAEVCPAGTDFENHYVVKGTTAESCNFCEVTVDDPSIQGFRFPFGIAYDEEKDRMYVANAGGHNVPVIDTTTNALIDTDGNAGNGITPITVGSQPLGIAYDGEKDRMYVVNNIDGTVSVIDTNTFGLIDTDGNAGNGITPITVGITAPQDIALDKGVGSNKIYVTHSGDDLLSVIDTNNFAVTPIDLPDTSNSFSLAYDSEHDTMYVTDYASDNVFVIDTSTNAIIDTITQADGIGEDPFGIVYDPDLKRMYVANNIDSTVSVIDTSDNTVIDTDGNAGNGITPITVGSQPVFIAYDLINHEIYVTNQGDDSVSVIDTTTNQVINTITVGDAPTGIAYDIIHERMYVVNQVDGTISVINLC